MKTLDRKVVEFYNLVMQNGGVRSYDKQELVEFCRRADSEWSEETIMRSHRTLKGDHINYFYTDKSKKYTVLALGEVHQKQHEPA